MSVLNPFGLFVASLSMYLLTTVLSLVFARKHTLCRIISNILCMLAAALSFIFSLQFIISGSGTLIIDVFKTQIPLLSFIIRIDSLSAYFILGLSIISFCISLYSIGYMSHYEGKKIGMFSFLYTAFILSMMLVFTSGNAILFLFTWELMSAVSYFLVVFA